MKSRFFSLLQIFLCSLLIGVLWNVWFLNGPHGPYRWVGMDFAPFWVGVRQMFSGINPYSPETLLKIQQVVYGGPALGEDPMMFVYPAWMFAWIAPFSFLPFPAAAILLISLLLWATLSFLFWLAQNLSSHQPERVFWLAAILVGSLPFLLISVTKGQLGYISLLALAGSRLLWPRSSWQAGSLLTLALLKPTVTLIPTLTFLLLAFWRRDWKFLAGFTLLLGGLFALSLIPAGNWIPGYLQMLSVKGGMPILWSLEILPAPWNFLYAALMLGLALLAFWTKNEDAWLDSGFVAGMGLTPMRWIYDLYAGILLLSAPAWRFASRAAKGLALLALLSPWGLILFPAPLRWNAMVIGLPLLWALTWLAVYLPAKITAVSSR